MAPKCLGAFRGARDRDLLKSKLKPLETIVVDRFAEIPSYNLRLARIRQRLRTIALCNGRINVVFQLFLQQGDLRLDVAKLLAQQFDPLGRLANLGRADLILAFDLPLRFGVGTCRNLGALLRFRDRLFPIP
jgi:hypothetical protein